MSEPLPDNTEALLLATAVTPDDAAARRAELLEKVRNADKRENELARLRAELERERQVARGYRSALADVRANLHAMGKRPEHCHEMSIIDDALAHSPPADTQEPTA